MQEEKQKALEKDMSIVIQSTFRGWAKRRQLTEQANREYAIPIIVRLVRRAPFVMRSYHPHILVLTVRSASGINMNGRSAPNPYMIVGAFNDSSKIKSGAIFIPFLISLYHPYLALFL